LTPSIPEWIFFVSATKLRSLFGHKIRTSQGLSLRHAITNGDFLMDREHIKGTAEKAKGSIKDTAGKVIGDKKLQSEGKLDKAKGSGPQCGRRY
jgi:predicted nucleotide-binding protein (sugar kinase/HSP70/actin superfamily)